jgi:hypothetical protein
MSAGLNYAVLLLEVTTTSLQRLAVADAKTGATAKPIGRRRSKGRQFLLLKLKNKNRPNF